MKKFLSILLAITLTASLTVAASAHYSNNEDAVIATAAPDYNGVLIKADGLYYPVQKGDVFTYTFYLNIGENLCSLNAETFYETAGLSWNGIAQKYDENDEEYVHDQYDLFPILGEAVILNANDEGKLNYNYTSTSGKKFTTDNKKLITARFTVAAESGVFEIDTILHTVTGAEGHKFIFEDKVVDPLQYAGSKLFDEVGGEIAPYEDPAAQPTEAPAQPTEVPSQPTEAPMQPTEAPVQPTEALDPTEAPTQPTDAQPTEASEFDSVMIKADGVYYAVQKGVIFTYTYYLNTGEKLCSLDAETYYDASGLNWNGMAQKYDEDEEEYYDDMSDLFPILGESVTLNSDVEGKLKYNYSNATGKKFDRDSKKLITAKFTVTAESGVYEINTFLNTVAGADKHNYILNYEIIDPLKYTGSRLFDADGVEIAPYEDPEAEPTDTPVQPTEAPVQPTDAPAQPTDAPAQPTDTPAQPTEAPVQPTEAPAQPTEAPAQPTEAPVQPTEAPAQPTEAPGFDGVMIKADGVYYAVQKGDIFTYTFYLNTGEKLCSLDADTFYDVEGLSWNGMAQKYDEDDEEYYDDLSDLFPILASEVTLNSDIKGVLKYNYSSAKGKSFKTDDKKLITAEFTVTAESGVYEINTFLHTVAGADNHKYLFNDEILDPLKYTGCKLFDSDSAEIAPYGGSAAEPTDEPAVSAKRGDVDGDGEITIFDASLIQKFLAKYESAMHFGIDEEL